MCTRRSKPVYTTVQYRPTVRNATDCEPFAYLDSSVVLGLSVLSGLFRLREF